MKEKEISLPIIIMREGEWYVASCPTLDIATQGKTEEEVKDNMQDLIEEYMGDDDIPKPEIESELTSLSFIHVRFPKRGNIEWENSDHLIQQR